MASNGTETVYSFNYDFDPVTSNLKSRDLHGTEEHFFYDTDGKQLNRLAGIGPDEYTVSETYAFADNGNITEKQGVGEYVYHPEKKNAVTQIDIPELGQNQDLVQFVSYNHFNSASEIKNLDDQTRVNLEYGPDDQRRLAKYWDESGAQDELIKTRLYAGAYEKQINADLTETEVHYISAGGQLAAMYVVENGVGSYYYPHQDHLGSIIHITDANGDVVYTQSFDPWGRTRNPSDLSYDNIPTRPDWLWRGYTGHEHLDEFGLINMNGRLYDPVVGRMLSPDNYVQNPDFSQSYNRYSYVWNNPLKYTDPDGEWVHIVVGAVFGGVMNWAANGAQFNKEGAWYFGVGALAGALSAGIGAGVSSMLAPISSAGSTGAGFFAGFAGTTAGVTSAGAAAGAITGAATGITSGFVTGTGNAIIRGEEFVFENGFAQAWRQGASGLVMGGALGGIQAKNDGLDFWTGKRKYTVGFWIDEQGNYVDMSSGKEIKTKPTKLAGNPRVQESRDGNGDWTVIIETPKRLDVQLVNDESHQFLGQPESTRGQITWKSINRIEQVKLLGTRYYGRPIRGAQDLIGARKFNVTNRTWLDHILGW